MEPALRDGKNVLVVSHGNALRALIKLVDGVSDEDAASTCPPHVHTCP